MQQFDVKATFGTTVRALRNRLSLSQEKLAERAELHRTYVSDVERGMRNVSLESIDRIARALGVSASVLFQTIEVSSPDTPEVIRSPATGLLDILLVEDNREDVELTLRSLKKAGLANHIHVAKDGQEAIDHLLGPDGSGERVPWIFPQVILLDLNLPKVNGLEVLRRLKANPRTRPVPVVVLTVSQRDKDIAVTRRLGADAYIVKPVGIQNLCEAAASLNLRWALCKPQATPVSNNP